MGNSSDFLDRSNIKFQNRKELKYLYQAKMLGANQKSINDFNYSLTSVQKKISYIKYPWANQIIVHLQNNQPDLYTQYEQILIQNCKRDGIRPKTLMSQKINLIYQESIIERYGLESKTLNLSELKNLIEECKNVFMVHEWFRKISSLSQADTHSRCCLQQQEEDHPGQQETVQIQCSETDKMCDYLINIACKTFAHCFQRNKGSYISSLNTHESKEKLQILPYLSKITRNMCFCDKQKAIKSLQNALKKLQLNKFHKNISFIEKVIQKRQIFGYLFVLREISKIDVEFLWKVFCQKHLKDLKN